MHTRKICAAAAALVIGALAFQAQAAPRDGDFKKALRLYRSGMYERAKDVFEDLGRSGDLLGEGYSALCAAKMQTEGFMDELDAYLLKYPESSLAPQIRFEKGLSLFDAGDYVAARREFASFTKEDLRREQVAEYVFKRAYSDYALLDYVNARERFLAVEKMPFSDYTAPSRYAIGYIDYSASDFDSAIKWFEQAAKDPRFAEHSNYYILECRFNNKDYKYVTDNGPAMFEKVPAERQPHLARIISESYLVQGNVDKAKEYFDKNLLSNETKTRSDYFYAGSILYVLKDYEGAVENFLGMSSFADSLGQIASYQMADSYLQMKNKVTAMECFREASIMESVCGSRGDSRRTRPPDVRRG
ncbi:MAG: tetratricopeptide repeat protein, partial [Bacteroidales bacterium]|nr:tetratricopeptide repeat protein [Bacteroidales bacterium]